MREMTLRELQLFALDILKDVSDFCIRNQIKYSLYGGTLLGAIRHSGFIPWDDDIDIIMPRNDYNRFCSIYKSKNYHVVNRNNDKSFQLAYSRVCDISKTIYKAVEPCSNKPTGVWIDVFPADGCPPNETDIVDFYKANQQLYQKTERVRWSMASFSSEWNRMYSQKGILRAIRRMIGLSYRKIYYNLSGKKDLWISRLIKLNSTYKYGETSFWGSFSCLYKSVVYHPMDSFNECILCKFEDAEFYILKGYDGLLKRVYGDYMDLPPKEQQKPPLEKWYKFYWI